MQLNVYHVIKKPSIFLILGMFFLSACGYNSSYENPQNHLVDLVNVFIGTDAGGNTTPAAHAPFGMVSCGPTNLFNESDIYTSRPGYYYPKDTIANFSLTHVSGWGCHGAQDIPFMPVLGEVVANPVYNPAAYASKFSHDNESATPGYYEVYLDDYDTKVKTAVSDRSCIVEVKYPQTGNPHFVFMPTNCSNGINGAQINIDIENSKVTGYATSGGFCTRDPKQYDYTTYFVAKFNKKITDYASWVAENGGMKQLTTNGDSIATYISFEEGTEALEVRIAISFVSIENAELNLETELKGKTLESLVAETKQKWNTQLAKMEINTGDSSLRTQLYTALYHNMLHPNIFEDVNGEYIGFNDTVYIVENGQHKYVNFSNWDTYRTTAQLQGMLFADRASDMINSMYLDSKQGCPSGFPIWGYFNNESWVMNGYSGLPLIANLYAFGGRDIMLHPVKERMIWAADNKYPRGDEYIKYGFVPDYQSDWNYSVSMTIEYAIADYSMAQMCRFAGDSVNYNRFIQRSEGIFQLFNEKTGYLQRKNKEGEWVLPFDSASDNGFNEGNSAQYTWNIPHNLPKLVEKMGGNEKTVAKLDHFGSKILIEGWNIEVPFYWPANQPSFVAPFVYNYAGAPEKAQALIKKAISEIFKNTPDGLPGNDDLGATSAMYLFAAAGMYPLKPGVPEFTLTGCIVDELVFKLNSGSVITVKAYGEDKINKPLKEIRINGKLYDSYFVNIEDIISSRGELLIEYFY